MTTKWACVGPGNIAFDFFLSIRENLPTQEHETAQCFNLPDYPVIGGVGMHLFGIYLTSLATMIFKEMPEIVTAEATMSKNGDRDVGGSVILKYKNGRMANLVYHMGACNTSNHIHVFGTKGTIKLVAVGARDLSRAKAFAEKFNFKKAYGSYDEVANDEDIEVVYIGTVTCTHVDLSIKMLEAGKHVLCEKPMALTVEDARKVFQVARQCKRTFMEGYWTRFFPAYQQIREELQRGTLGDIRMLSADFCIKLTLNPEVEAGGLFAIGVYVLTVACLVFGEKPQSVKAEAFLGEQTGNDVGGALVLKYKNGGLANLSYHLDIESGNTSACIMGNKQSIQIHGPFWASEKITIGSQSYEYPLKKGDYILPGSAGLQYEATAMRETILKGNLENEFCSWRDSEMVLEIIEEIEKQIGTK